MLQFGPFSISSSCVGSFGGWGSSLLQCWLCVLQFALIHVVMLKLQLPAVLPLHAEQVFDSIWCLRDQTHIFIQLELLLSFLWWLFLRLIFSVSVSRNSLPPKPFKVSVPVRTASWLRIKGTGCALCMHCITCALSFRYSVICVPSPPFFSAVDN